MINDPFFATRIDNLTRRWNALIPGRAVTVQHGERGVRYLHPTKGWRTVSYRRLGLT